MATLKIIYVAFYTALGRLPLKCIRLQGWYALTVYAARLLGKWEQVCRWVEEVFAKATVVWCNMVEV